MDSELGNFMSAFWIVESIFTGMSMATFGDEKKLVDILNNCISVYSLFVLTYCAIFEFSNYTYFFYY